MPANLRQQQICRQESYYASFHSKAHRVPRYKSELNFISSRNGSDHGHLQPWRFIVAENEGLASLGQAFRQAATVQEIAELIERAANLPYRAPLVIAVASITENHVPVIEQQIAAVVPDGYAASRLWYWRYLAQAISPMINGAKELGLAGEQIVGFLYLGQEAAITAKTRLMPRVCTSYL